jgi:hypothetical protein
MSLKDIFRGAIRSKRDKSAMTRDAMSPWEWLIDGAKTDPSHKTGPTFRSAPPGGSLSQDRTPGLLAERERRKYIEEKILLQKQAELKVAESKRLSELRTIEYKKQADAVLFKNSDLVNKFMEIAERKVSILDDYGDENWDALPDEIHKCLTKIAKSERWLDISKTSVRSQFHPNLKKLLGGYNEPCARYLAANLDLKFRTYHEARKESTVAQNACGLAGADFEAYLARLLRDAGFEIAGTPASGDQGADLIAKKSGRTIAIQAKGYRGSVGNGAVQEVVGAIRFYRADEGWVITNSTFTASARALAQANNVRLFDGNDLKDPGTFDATER